VGPFVDHELDDPELDASFEHDKPQSVPRMVVGKERARTIRIAKGSVRDARTSWHARGRADVSVHAGDHHDDGSFDVGGEIEETIDHEVMHHQHDPAGDDPLDDEERDAIEQESIRRVGQQSRRSMKWTCGTSCVERCGRQRGTWHRNCRELTDR
jgi:hypothetical protein